MRFLVCRAFFLIINLDMVLDIYVVLFVHAIRKSKVTNTSLHKKMKKSLMENFIFCAVFLLRCHFHSSQRLELFDNLDKVNPSFFNLSAKDQDNILLSSYSSNNSISLSQGIIKLVINFLIKYVCFDRQLRKQ